MYDIIMYSMKRLN